MREGITFQFLIGTFKTKRSERRYARRRTVSIPHRYVQNPVCCDAVCPCHSLFQFLIGTFKTVMPSLGP